MTLDDALKKYEDRFDSFPTIPLMLSRTDAEIIAIIQNCLDEDKDVYDLRYMNLDTDY